MTIAASVATQTFRPHRRSGSGHVVRLLAGATIRRELQRWIEDLEIEHGYQHVITPAVAKRELYVKSATGTTSAMPCTR